MITGFIIGFVVIVVAFLVLFCIAAIIDFITFFFIPNLLKVLVIGCIIALIRAIKK